MHERSPTVDARHALHSQKLFVVGSNFITSNQGTRKHYFFFIRVKNKTSLPKRRKQSAQHLKKRNSL